MLSLTEAFKRRETLAKSLSPSYQYRLTALLSINRQLNTYLANQVRRLGELVGHLQEEQHRELVRPKSTAGLRQTGRAVTTWAFLLGHLAQPLLSPLRMKM